MKYHLLKPITWTILLIGDILCSTGMMIELAIPFEKAYSIVRKDSLKQWKAIWEKNDNPSYT